MDRYLQLPDIRLHYLDYPGGQPAGGQLPIVYLPGLTANAHYVEGLVAAGLSARYRVLAVDMRGRGLSDKPATGYSMPQHAGDIAGLMDALAIEQAVICGHSFGGLIAIVLAALYPARFPKVILIDAAVQLISQRTRDLIKSSLDRLEVRLPSMDVYMAAMRQMPYLQGFWDAQLETYYRGDVREFPDGSVQPLAAPGAIAECIDMQFSEPWAEHVAAIRQPVLLINAPDPYGPPGAPPLLPAEVARQSIAQFADGRLAHCPGNHVTMLFGDNARCVVEEIAGFVS